MGTFLSKTLFAALIILLAAMDGWGAGASLSVSATVLSKSTCRFNTAAGTLAFGTLDPSNPVDVSVTSSLIYRCNGSQPLATFLITDDDGLNESGADANRMQHSTLAGNLLSYQLSYAPVSATVPKGTNQTLTITGVVLGTGYQSAVAGAYTDTVILSIAP